jgi:ribonuclease HI
MEQFEEFFILINAPVGSSLSSTSNSSTSNSPTGNSSTGNSSIHVSLRDRGGKIVEEISENALLSDKNFRDLAGLSIGLTQAKKLGARSISIETSNIFLEILINDRPGRTWKDNYGFHSDIKRLVENFERVEVKITGQEKEQTEAA